MGSTTTYLGLYKPDTAENDWGTLVDGNFDTIDSTLVTVSASSYTANYTLALTDIGTVVEMNKATSATLTVPPNSSVAFPVGTVIEVCQYGAGQVTIMAGAGVTLRSPFGVLTTTTQYSSVSLRKRATDEWMVEGDLG